jgi:hypothetical protein
LSSDRWVFIFSGVGTKALLKKHLVYLLTLALVAVAMPKPVNSAGQFKHGDETAEEATAIDLPSNGASPFAALGHAYAFGDTTEYDLPEEPGKPIPTTSFILLPAPQAPSGLT